MSLIYGFDNHTLDNANKAASTLCSAISTYDAIQLAYKKLSLSCEESGKAAAKASAKALSKANSASYRARKAGEVADDAMSLAEKVDDQCNSNIQTFSTVMEFTQYGKPRVVKTFRTGIVLLGIDTKVTKDSKETALNGRAFYDFYDVTGSTHMAEIRNRQGSYEVIDESSDDKIVNIQDVYSSPKPCTISINLLGKDKTSKPAKPVKLNITIQYIELRSKNKKTSDVSDMTTK